ncbi:MAG: elongation factor G [Phycisphaerales bacterium]
MPSYTTSQIRNIALTGHSGAGKTTLVECLMHHAKAIGRMGSVEEGNTVCDYEQEEKDHKHSLYSTVVNFDFNDHHFNLIDTPGFPDFLGQTLSVMPAVETVAIVIGADRGIQTTTRRVMSVASDRKLPRMVIINKIDDHMDELEGLLAQLQETFGREVLPVNLPTPDGSDVVDLWEKSDGEVAFSSVAEGHTAIIDQVVEVDEKLMESYLSQGSLSKEQLHDAFEKALREGHLVPVLFCSSRTGAGIDDMLHIFEVLCPSPCEGNPRPFVLTKDGEESEWFAAADPSKTTVAHVFKVTTDQFVGKLAMARVHQGTIKAGESLHIGDSKKPVRLAHLLKINGKDHAEVQEAVPGDIIGLTKIDELHPNSVLHAGHDLDNLRFKVIAMPRPMYGLAVEAKSRNDEAKVGGALAKLAEEDPTFQVERVAATHQTVLRAMGELHMRMMLERLKNRFKLELDTQPPRIAYAETIAGKAEGHHRHKKQTGGAGQFGEVYLRIEPLSVNGDIDSHDPWAGRLEFVDETVGGSVPRQFMPAIEKGIKQAMEGGAIAGYPVRGVRVSVYDGKYHPVDSKEVAFVAAGKRAFIDAFKKARPVLLEPFVEVEITAPNTSMGDITSDLSGKRGQIEDTQIIAGDLCMIRAKAPLSEMNNYSSQLKSMTGGQGSFVMDYSHDEQTPPNVQADIVAQFKPHEEED